MRTPAARRLKSIRARMLTGLLWITLVWGLIAPLAVLSVVRHEISELLDDTLYASAEVLSGALKEALQTVHGRQYPPGGVTIEPVAKFGHGRFAWQLVGPGQQVLLRSPHAPERPLLPAPFAGLSDGNPDWRVLGVSIGAGGEVLYVAQSTVERFEAFQDMTVNTALVALLVWVLSAFGLYRRIRAELNELSKLEAGVLKFDPLDAAQPSLEVSRSELLPIRDAIVDLGRRLVVRVRNERAFTAHAAHALRTPLAGMDAQLAVAMRECPPEMQPRLQRVRDSTSRFARVVNALLTLFRSGSDLSWQSVDVATLLGHLPVAGLEVRTVPAGAQRVQADPDLLAAALANLLDNAVRHGARVMTVQVPPSGAGMPSRIVLSDDGPGMTLETMTELQSALDREDYGRSPGLGLMLGDLIARAHGGRLRLAPGEPSGLVVELTLGPAPLGAA